MSVAKSIHQDFMNYVEWSNKMIEIVYSTKNFVFKITISWRNARWNIGISKYRAQKYLFFEPPLDGAMQGEILTYTNMVTIEAVLFLRKSSDLCID